MPSWHSSEMMWWFFSVIGLNRQKALHLPPLSSRFFTISVTVTSQPPGLDRVICSGLISDPYKCLLSILAFHDIEDISLVFLCWMSYMLKVWFPDPYNRLHPFEIALHSQIFHRIWKKKKFISYYVIYVSITKYELVIFLNRISPCNCYPKFPLSYHLSGNFLKGYSY